MTTVINSSASFDKRYLAALLVIAAIAMSLRLYGLTTIGVGGSDTILYYTLAEQWLQGNFVYQIGNSVSIFRPVLLGINALALKLFGHTDYALKLSGVLFDCASLLLLSALAWAVSRRPPVVIASAMTYAVLPIAVWASRQELPHTLSTFFVLATCLFFVRAFTRAPEKPATNALLLAGVSLGAAALTHEELIFLVVPLAAFLWFAHTPQGVRPSLRENLKRVGAFVFVPVLAVAVMLIGQFSAVQSVVNKTVGAAGAGVGFWTGRLPRFMWDAIVGTTSASMAFALVLCGFYIAWSVRRNAPDSDPLFNRWASFCLLLPIIHIAIYALFFNTLFSRGFLPLVPLLVIALFFCLARVMAGINKGLVVSVTVVIVALLGLSNLASYSAFNVGNRRFSATWAEPVWPNARGLQVGSREFLVDGRYVPSYATHWGALYRYFEGAVDANNKLLLLPSTSMYSAGRRAPQLQVYFGDNVIYRLDHFDQSLAEIVREHDVKWVVYTTGQQRSIPKGLRPYRYNGVWAESVPVDLARSYGMDTYSAQAEYMSLLEFLKEAGAAQGNPFPPDSYEYRVTRVFRLR